MLNLDNIRFNINKSNIDFSEVSQIVFSKDLIKLMDETEKYGKYGPSDKYNEYWGKLEDLFLKVCQCILDLQNKDKVRIQIMEETSDDIYTDIKIFINNKIINRSNYTDYNYYRLYFYLIPYYEMPEKEEMIRYRKSL